MDHKTPRPVDYFRPSVPHQITAKPARTARQFCGQNNTGAPFGETDPFFLQSIDSHGNAICFRSIKRHDEKGGQG